MGATNFPGGVNAAPTNSVTDVSKTASATLTDAECISGGTIVVTGDGGEIITIPNAASGNIGANVTVVNHTKGAVRILPHSSDFIKWGGALTVAKYVENTAATAKKGDYITLMRNEAATGWYVTAVSGIWAKQA